MIRPPRRCRTPRRHCAACAARGHSVSVCSPRRRGSPVSGERPTCCVFVPTLVALVALAVAQPPGVFEEALIRFLAAFPGWLEPVWGFLLGAAGVWVAALVIASLVRRRWDIAAQALLALAFAIVASAIAARIALGDWPSLAPTLGRYAGDPIFPNVRLALAVALVTAVSGHLVQPARRLSHWILLLAAAAEAIGGTAQPSGRRSRFPDRHPGRRCDAHGGRRIDRLAERAGCHRGVVGARRPDRRADPGRAAARRGREPARPGSRRPRAHRQGLRARRVRQSAAGQALAHAHVSRERPCARAQPLAGGRARGIRHHARAPGGRARAGSRDGRRHHRRGRTARAPHERNGSRRILARSGRRRAPARRLGGARSAEEGEHRPRRHRPLRHPRSRATRCS